MDDKRQLIGRAAAAWAIQIAAAGNAGYDHLDCTGRRNVFRINDGRYLCVVHGRAGQLGAAKKEDRIGMKVPSRQSA